MGSRCCTETVARQLLRGVRRILHQALLHRAYLRRIRIQPLPDLHWILPPPETASDGGGAEQLFAPLSPSASVRRDRVPSMAGKCGVDVLAGVVQAQSMNTRPKRSISQLRKLKQAVSGSKIRCATLPKLVEYLTSPYSHGTCVAVRRVCSVSFIGER
jgi:hypothetical protein